MIESILKFDFEQVFHTSFVHFPGLLAFVPAILLPYIIDFFFNQNVPVWQGFLYLITLVLSGTLSTFLFTNGQFLANLFAMKARSL